MSDSVQPHRWQPTRLPNPWDSLGKNTRVGCHFLLQCMKGKSESEVAQLCLTLSDPMDCSPLGSSIHGIFQAKVLEWGAIFFSYIDILGISKLKWTGMGEFDFCFVIIFCFLEVKQDFKMESPSNSALMLPSTPQAGANPPSPNSSSSRKQV